MIDAEFIKASGEEEDVLATIAQRTFASGDGQKLLEALCKYRNPLESRFSDSDPIKAAVRDGEANIVALLWRWGSKSKSLPE